MQTLPSSAEAYHQAQRQEIDAALRAIARQWSVMSGAGWLSAWNDQVASQILAILLVAQTRVAAPVGGYVSEVLRELGLSRLDDPVAEVRPAPTVGYAGDGRSVEGLTRVSVDKVFTVLDAGGSTAQALDAGYAFMNVAAATVLSDTARQMEALHTGVRPVAGYVRMLNPPSCSRCAILAGRKYRWNTGFQRHPGCDCRHIPTAESVSGDLTVDPKAYFESLPTDREMATRYPGMTRKQRREAGVYSQEEVFTKAGAEAIRLGADPVQVVNVRRGMSTAQPIIRETGARETFRLEVAGKTLFEYDEPIREVIEGSGRLVRDRRGLFTTEEATLTRRGSNRTGLAKGERRLMPESIFELSNGDRDLAVSLLRQYGYVT